MNWNRVLLAALVGGIANNLVNFLLHGVVLSGTYAEYPEVFVQGESNPLFFLLVALFAAVILAILFARTRQCWASGAKGGLFFGALAGALVGTTYFFDPLTIEGFPYYLAWCSFTIEILGYAAEGRVMAVFIKRES